MTRSLPTGSADVAYVATPEPSSATVASHVLTLPTVLVNVTSPVGTLCATVASVTVAVKLTELPSTDGFVDAESAVFDAAGGSDGPASADWVFDDASSVTRPVSLVCLSFHATTRYE